MDSEEYVAVWRYREHVREVRAMVARPAVPAPAAPVRARRASVGGRLLPFVRWLLGAAGTGSRDLHGSGLPSASPRN
jgi:hypothetical protein